MSRRRIVAEHGIGKMKVWRIAVGAVPQPGPAAHADHEERGRAAQPDVCLTEIREGKGTPSGQQNPIVQRL